MKISAINANSALYTTRNKSLRNRGMQDNTAAPVPTPQNVNFQASGLKIGLGAIGAMLGGLVVGGPVGAVIGAVAGLKGADLVEADIEAKARQEEEKNKSGKK